jgi:hypothetical protein
MLNYVRDNYGQNFTIENFEDKNYGYDYIFKDKNCNITVESKNRYFNKGVDDLYLKKNDILIELIQTVPVLKQLDIKNINNNKPYDINISIGWFYKCNAQRLIFFRYLDKILYDVIDIDFFCFKNWFMNNIHCFKLNYCSKTTKTINAIVLIKDIPKIYLKHTIY